METFEEKRIEEEVKASYLDYAMSVIIGRALPDARDGLKPVQRRILFAMKEMGLTHDKPFKKCARIVGEVLGKFHPHGDAPVYDALVRMAQPFSMRYPLIQPQGNFGSIDGDPPAAMRYTEARLSPIAEAMLEDLDKDCVPFKDNFDGTLREPEVLPGKFPNLLCNGSTGIAVGMSTSIPPHNLREVVNSLLALMEGRDPLEEIRGPDFPTGGLLIGNVKEVYRQGKGSFRLRARARFSGNRIIIYEIPYHVNKAELVRQIALLIKERRLNASEVRDRSDREGIRVEVVVKRGFDPRKVFRDICRKTQAEITFRINFVALDHGVPSQVSFTDLLRLFLEHRREVVRRRTSFLLRKYRERVEILRGFLKVAEDPERIVRLVKEADDRAAALSSLLSLGFSERQAKAILEMKLASLVRLETEKMKEELSSLQERIRECEVILSSPERLDEVIKEELKDLAERFGDARRTLVAEGEESAEETLYVGLTNSFVVLGEAEAKAMRSLRGLWPMGDLLIFSEEKVVRAEPDYLLGKRPEDFKAIRILPFFPKGVLLFSDGKFKKVSLEISRKRAGVGLPGRLVDACLISSEYLLVSAEGRGFRVADAEVKEMGWRAKGVAGISGGGMAVLPKRKWILLWGEGRFLKIPWEEVPILHRGAKGVKLAGFEIAWVESADDEEEVVWEGRRKKVKDLPVGKRASRGIPCQGVRLRERWRRPWDKGAAGGEEVMS